MRKVFGFALIAVGLASCDGGNSIVEERLATVRSSMKDPYSVRFEDVVFLGDGDTLCGSVNAKNSMGAYTGNKNFVVTSSGIIIEEEASDLVEYEAKPPSISSSYIYRNAALDRMIEETDMAIAMLKAEESARAISDQIKTKCALDKQSKRYAVPAEGPAKVIK